MKQGLVIDRDAGLSGRQRIYRWGRWGLSIVDGRRLHPWPFYSEAAVIHFSIANNDDSFTMCYTTPLTNDVAVFETQDQESAFIMKAMRFAKKNQRRKP